jgi:predicted transcriptional regulator
MKTITFTTEDELAQLLTNMAKENEKDVSEIIADSLRCYADILQRKKLQQQIKRASALTAAQSLQINQSLDASHTDGL